MLRIGLAGAALVVTCFGAVTNHLGVASEGRGGVENASTVPAELRPNKPEQFGEALRFVSREVIWRPDSSGENPIGFIPTQWTVRPQLLPRTWDVETIYARESRQR